MTRYLSQTALTHHGPSCSRCADWAHGYADGYQDGHAAGYIAGAAEGPAHPAVVDSVARIFHGWAGPAAALRASVHRVRGTTAEAVTHG